MAVGARLTSAKAATRARTIFIIVVVWLECGRIRLHNKGGHSNGKDKSFQEPRLRNITTYIIMNFAEGIASSGKGTIPCAEDPTTMRALTCVAV
jgi:hypothetical protein